MVRLQTNALRACADDVRALRRYTTEISDCLQAAATLDPQGRQPYLRSIQKAEMLDRCFSGMSNLLTQISEDADVTSQQIRKIAEQYVHDAEQRQ